MELPITLLFAAIFAIFGLLLSFFAGALRGAAGIPILHGDPINKELAVRVRRHQNFLEYVPMVLILMAAIELNDGSTSFLYGIGIALIVARVAHAVGLQYDNMGHLGRLVGAGGTALITMATAGYALCMAVPAVL
ncbi:MAG: MAPEG family protein [Hyphomicrobiaceae bacterium]